MESESIDPSLISNPPSLFTDAPDVSDFNLSDAHAAQLQIVPIPCQRFSRDDNGNLKFCFCPRCVQEDLGFAEHPPFPSFIANNGISTEPQDAPFGSAQLETSGLYWPVLADSQSLSIDTHGEQAVRSEKQRRSRKRAARVSKPRTKIEKMKVRSKKIHPRMIVARLQQSLQIDPSCSPKFKSECSKLLEQVKGLMDVEMGRPKTKDSLNISHMQDVTSVGRSDSSQRSVSQLADDVFSTADGSDSAPESSPSSKSRSQQNQGRPPIETATPAPSRAGDRPSRLYQCTYRACTQSFRSKTDWKRHEGSEKHWLQQKYMCLECDTSAIDSTGMLECLYCSGLAEDVGDIRTHNLQCDPARKLGRTFTRKDHFRNHLRQDHGMPLTSAASTWVYAIESDWPRQCGFCGIIVDTWAQRANHIEDHFKRGHRISSWKLPFPRIPDPNGKRRRDDSSDGSTNSSNSSSSIDSGFSAKDRCAVGGVANHGPGAKPTPENRGSCGDQTQLQNTNKTLVYRRTSISSSNSGISQSSLGTSFYGQRLEAEYFYRFRAREEFHRVPDDERKFIRSITSRSKKILVVEHRKRIYDECAPVSVTALPRDFEDTKKGRRQHKPNKSIPIAENCIAGLQSSAVEKRDISANHQTLASSAIGNSDSQMIVEKGKHTDPWNASKEIAFTMLQRLAPDHSMVYTIHRYLSDPLAPNPFVHRLKLRPEGSFKDPGPLESKIKLEPNGLERVPGTIPKSVPVESSRFSMYGSIQSKERVTYATSSTGFASSTSCSSSARSLRDQSTTSSRGRDSSIASTDSVADIPPGPPPWAPLPLLNEVLASTPFNHGYDLPCEFGFTGCCLRFHPEDFEDWIDHSISHFGGHPPPMKSSCTFCDRFFEADKSLTTWRKRMEHIGRHFYDLKRSDEVNHCRPDFLMIEHLKRIGLLSEEDYRAATGYTERPFCAGLVPLDYKTTEMVRKENRSLLVPYDLEKEERQRRKQLRQRGSNSTHRNPRQRVL